MTENVPAVRSVVGASGGTERGVAIEVRRDGAGEAIGSWLNVLSSLLRLPESDRAAIRDELYEHLRERVRDLMLSGCSETDAVRLAIGELGEAGLLARRYRQAAHSPRRRFLMNGAIFGLAGAAMVTSLVALSDGPRDVPVSVFQSAQVGAPGMSQLKISCSDGTSWEELFNFMGEMAKKPVFVHWGQLREFALPGAPEGGERRIEASSPVGMEFKDVPMEQAIKLINEALRMGADDGIAVREQEGTFVFSTVAHFDRLERTLATFDLGGLVASRRASLNDANYPAERVVEEVSQVICKVVHADMWAENGGDRAQLSAYDNKLFVSVPKRVLPKVEWVISQMPKTEKAAQAGSGEPVTEIYPIKHTDSTGLAGQICKKSAEQFAGIRVVPESHTNSLVVSTTAANQGLVAKLIEEFDRPVEKK